jgi:hypothetical protein
VPPRRLEITMSEATRALPETHPGEGDHVDAALTAIYNWNYEPEIDQIRTLYANGLDRQWIAMRDLDWHADIDREAFTQTFSMGGIPISETKFWKGLPLETRWNVSRCSAAFMLSNFLHGEQGALMVAGQMVSAVPHMDGKFYAATQTMDEARHVEAFAAYIEKLGEVHEITPGLRELLDRVISVRDWKFKAVGMQIVIEGLALYLFRDMRNRTGEPLLQKLLTYVSRDEARHTGYGIKYLAHVVPGLSVSADGVARRADDARPVGEGLERLRGRSGARVRRARGGARGDRAFDAGDGRSLRPGQRLHHPDTPRTRSLRQPDGRALQGDVDGRSGRRGGTALCELRRRTARRPGAVGERGLRDALAGATWR